MAKLGYKHTIYASYLGYITQAIVNNLAPLLFLTFREQYGIPLSKITVLITVNFLLQLCVDYISTFFVDRIGYKISIMAAHVFAAAGLVSMAVLPNILPDAFAGLLVSVFLYAIGGGLTEVLISPIVEACPSENKAGAMSLLHSFYCWGTVAVVFLSTLFIVFVGRDKWPLLSCLWAIVPVANTFYFAAVPVNALTEEGDGMTVGQLAKTPLFWLFVVLMVASGASEQAMSQWVSSFTESGLGVSKTVGDLAGTCMFSTLMGIARVFYGKMSEKIDLVKAILCSCVLCIVSYFVSALCPSPIISLIGCALCGLSVGILWPGIFATASAGFRNGGTALFALLALAGDLGCSSGPTVVGEVSAALGDNLKLGILAGAAFPVVLIVGILIYRNRFCAKK